MMPQFPVPPLPRPRDATLSRLLGYWTGLTERHRLPGAGLFDVAAIPELLSDMYLLSVETGGRRFRIRLMGAHLEEILGGDFTGRTLDELTCPNDGHIAVVLGEHEVVVESGKPSRTAYDFVTSEFRHFRFERLLLPLASDGSTVDAVVGVVHFERPSRSHRDPPWPEFHD